MINLRNQTIIYQISKEEKEISNTHITGKKIYHTYTTEEKSLIHE